MAKYRIGYMIFFIIATILMLAYKSKLTSIIFLFFAILPLLSLLLGILSSALLKITVTYGSTSYEKLEATEIRVRIKNRFIMPLSPISILGTLPMKSQNDFLYQNVLISIPPFSSLTVKFSAPIKYRGVYESGVEKAKVFDFLKLFTFNKKINRYEKIKILPRKLIINSLSLHSDGDSEKTSPNSFSLYKSSFSTVREYRPDDSVKHMHWKLSAKYGKPLVKQFEKSVGGNSIIITDLNEYFPFDEENAEYSDCVIETSLAINSSLIESKHNCLNLWFSSESNTCRQYQVRDDLTLNAFYNELSLIPRQKEIFLPESIADSITEIPVDTSAIFFITSQIRKDFILKMNQKALFQNRKTIILLLSDYSEISDFAVEETINLVSGITGIELWRIDKKNIVDSLNDCSKLFSKQNTEI